MPLQEPHREYEAKRCKRRAGTKYPDLEDKNTEPLSAYNVKTYKDMQKFDFGFSKRNRLFSVKV